MSAVTQNGNLNEGHNHVPVQHQDDKHSNRSFKISKEREVPPVISELVEECFAPGIKGYFEQRTSLPLLKSTNLAIIKRRQSSEKRVKSAQMDFPILNGNAGRMRCSSIGAGFYDSSDLYIVRACWEIILSFMGDEQESLEKGQSTGLFESTIDQRRQNLTTKKKIWRKSSNVDAVIKKKYVDKSSNRPSSMILTSDYNGNTNPHHKVYEKESLKTSLPRETLLGMTVLEKVRFLTNVGLENTCFRDEIYCQIIKQLVCNTSVRSTALGWILLSLITGCFSPSEKMLGFAERFLEHQRTACGAYCLEKLTRTLLNGDRKNPPCSLELQAAKSRKQIRVPVICMDHSVRTIWTDSATTAEEMCAKIASKNRLEDSFGFSLYLALDKKLVSLGSNNFRIMDAISQAERFSKLNDVHEVWRIYYRREFFTALDASGIQNNQMKTWLTYSQMCGGVQSGEYQCTNAQDLALLMAHQYCVRHGLEKVNMKRIVAVCDQNLPASVYVEGKKKKWCNMVYTTLKALEAKARRGRKLDTLDIMHQVVRYGSKAFLDNFTKSFLLSNFQAVSEKGHCVIDAMLKINHIKIVVCRNGAILRINESESENQVLLEFDVGRLKLVEMQKTSQGSPPEVKLTLKDDKVYTIGSSQLKEITKILQRFITEDISRKATDSKS